MSEELNRRKLKSRHSSLAQNTAKWLSSKNISPNQISVMSVIFSLAGAVCLFYYSESSGHLVWILPTLTALFIQCRLLCNLFDGMVAVEGGKGTPAGELFNDIPDRIADSLLFIAAGYAAAVYNEHAVILGWGAALLAIFTAYIRTLAAATGAPVDFCGPMAKQHRMFTLTLSCLLTGLETVLKLEAGIILFYALAVICFGSLITSVRRAGRAYNFLEKKNV